jgi:hypothetical protein
MPGTMALLRKALAPGSGAISGSEAAMRLIT